MSVSTNGIECVVRGLVSTANALESGDPLPLAAAQHREDLGRNAQMDPLNAIVRHTSVKGVTRGSLTGLRLTVKDSIAIGGIPMSCGSAALQGFMPSGDSTVVARVLNEGAEVAAVTNMDDLAFAGSGETSYYGPTRNPFSPALLSGGSSGGAAASLHYGLFDAAIGTDQGGSVRVPASWCGVIGLKPTHGLIPYTGVAAMEPSLDHVGLLATSVHTLARVLTAIAGRDGQDLRQHKIPVDLTRNFDSSDSAAGDLRRWRLGVVDATASTASPPVREAFTRVLDRIESLGGSVTRSDFNPSAFGPITTGLFLEGVLQTILGVRTNFGGTHFEWVEFTEALREGVEREVNRLSPTFVASLRAAENLNRSAPGTCYSRALAARERLRTSYFTALDNVDFLVEPTVPLLPLPVGGAVDAQTAADRGWSVLTITGNANAAGLPAISLPLGTHDGLPVGVMVTARPWQEHALLSFAHACEHLIGWNRGITPESTVRCNT